MKKYIILLSIAILSSILTNARLIKTDFIGNESIGSDLEKGVYVESTDPIMPNQWNLSHEDNYTAGSSPKITAGLNYDGYIGAEDTRGIELNKLETGNRVSVYSLTDENIYHGKPFYLSFLVNVKTATFSSGSNSPAYFDFIAFAENYQGSTPRGRIYLGKSHADGSNIVFGIKESYSDEMAATDFETYETNVTYLFVLKYDPTVDGQDMKLYINPPITEEEPTTATLTQPKSTNISGIKAIYVKQSVANHVQISGLRFSDSWAGAIGYSPIPKEISPVITGPLTYNGYSDSGKDHGILLEKLEESSNHPAVYSLTSSTSELSEGSYFLSFLLNVQKPFLPNKPTGFLYLSPNYNGIRGRGKVYFSGIDSNDGSYKIGLKDNSNDNEIDFPINYATTTLNADSTYLVVLKTNLENTEENLKLYINPEIGDSEPETPSISCNRTTINPLTYIRGLCVNQSDVANITIGGIRFADSYAGAIGYSDPVSVESKIITSKIKVHPNPSTEYINLETPQNQKFDIIISDLWGRNLIYKENISSTESVNIKKLSPGYYLIKFIKDKSVINSTKILKQ